MSCGQESGLMSVDEALHSLVEQVKPLSTVQLPLSEALHRYLAKAVYSAVPLPMFSQSAVDGYALCSAEAIQSGQRFELVGEVRAGQTQHICLAANQAVRIFTGGPIPENTTTIARQEIVQLNSAMQIQVIQDLSLNVDLRHQGEEIAVGQCLAEQGQRLHVGAIAALSMIGVSHVEVFEYPKVAILISGDEVASSIADRQVGQIFDANGPMLQAWFAQQQQPVHIIHVADEVDSVRQKIQSLAEDYDVILTTGGVSVGDYDFIRPVSLALGFEQIFWKIKQKPGKPMFFAKRTKAADACCYLLGLPGNPAAVFVGLQIYATALLLALQGNKNAIPWFSARLSHALNADQRERFLRMSARVEQGEIQLCSLKNQQSHMLSNLMQANCLVRVPAGLSVEAGDTLQALLL